MGNPQTPSLHCLQTLSASFTPSVTWPDLYQLLTRTSILLPQLSTSCHGPIVGASMATRARAKNSDGRTRQTGRAGLRRRLVEREILERAAELFAERGFAGTTVQDIADALGMSRPALYYYVKSKDVLLEQLVENLSINDAKVLEEIRRRRTGDPVEKLHAMAQHLATNAGSNPHQ